MVGGACGRRRVDSVSEVSDEDMENFTTKMHAMSSQILVMIRIAAEVIEGIGVGSCGKPCAERGTEEGLGKHQPGGVFGLYSSPT